LGLSLPGVTGVLAGVEMAENAAIAGRGRRDRRGRARSAGYDSFLALALAGGDKVAAYDRISVEIY